MNEPIATIHQIVSRNAAEETTLIATLHELQKEFNYLPPEALVLASTWLRVPLSQAYAVATFYSAFSLVPRGKHCFSVCMGTACHVRGSPRLLDWLTTRLGISAGETTSDRLFTVDTVNCLGACALGPIVVTDGEYSGQMTSLKVDRLLKRTMKGVVRGEHGKRSDHT